MAFIDCSENLLVSLNGSVGHLCGPCETGGNRKEAKQYCEECSEYLCDICVEHHTKLSLLKTHKVIRADAVSVNTGRRLTVYCACNIDHEIDSYCEEHADVICSSCRSLNHRNCQISPIQNKSAGYTLANLKSIISRTRSLKDKYRQIKQKSRGKQKDLKKSKEACKKEIKAFRKELDTFLDKLEQKMLAELAQFETNEQLHLDQLITSLITASQMLDSNCQMLEDAKTDGRKHVMFAADVQVSKGLQSYESRLADLERDVDKLTISFETNKKLVDLQKDITTLGLLKLTESIENRRSKTTLLRQQTGSRREVNVRLTDDKKDPLITGCVVMPNDYVVICDFKNHKLKLLNNTLILTDSCKISGLYDVSVLDTNNAIVTIPGVKKLQQVQIFPQLKVGRAIQLDKMCCGVEVSGENIYVSCTDGNLREVIVLDKQGNLQRRIECSKNSSLLFSPSFITVNKSGDKIFVSNWNNNTITCMTADDRIIYQYREKDLKPSRGLYCDDSDNILVCCSNSNTVHMITAEGKFYNTILSSRDGLHNPHSIAYRQSDNIFIVGCESLNHLLVYQLAQ